MSYLVVLFQDNYGDTPDAEDAVRYQIQTDTAYPVLADFEAAVYDAMPIFPSLPSKCVLDADMRMVECYSEHDDEQGYAAIEADAAAP